MSLGYFRRSCIGNVLAKMTSATAHFIELPGAEMGKVVTRFPPEPSGYLHIGHAKAALLNSFYATHYKGKLILRFDDTNPAKESVEFEDSIKEDLNLLEVKPDHVSHTSDHFEKLLEIMTNLLKEGKGYCDYTPPDLMKEERTNSIESKCRGQSVDENLRLWGEMQKGSEEGLKCCVRLRLCMTDKNKCMRDPTMYRCVVTHPHHIHGTKYKVYPTYDFACPIVDSIEGVTHALRTNEYADRIPQYNKVIEVTGLRPVTIYEFSRLNFVRTVLSKRKLQWFVDNRKVSGWDDPRFPTVRGILRRGLQIPALMDLLLQQGPSQRTNLMEWDKLWSLNKQLIDPIVPRYMAVDNDCVKLTLRNVPKTPEVQERFLHPKNEKMGRTKITYAQQVFLDRDDANLIKKDEEITLMRWGNVIVTEVVEENGVVIELMGDLHLEGDFKKTKVKVHWLPEAENCYESCTLMEYDHLIKPDKIDPEDTRDISEFLTDETSFKTAALVDKAVSTLKIGEIIQLERRGYFRIDSVEKELILIKIPDGKAKAMSKIAQKVDAASLAKGDENSKKGKQQVQEGTKKALKKELQKAKRKENKSKNTDNTENKENKDNKENTTVEKKINPQEDNPKREDGL